MTWKTQLRKARRLLAVLTASVFTCSSAFADEGEAADFHNAPTLNMLGLSLAYQAPHNLDKDFTGGIGLLFSREYFVFRRLSLGPQVAPRFFPTAPGHFALGYGLEFRHYVGNFGATPQSGLYGSYGLMMQLNWVSGLDGVAVGHDTKMGVGFDWDSEKLSPAIEANYHLTQVRYFDTRTIWWPFAEIVVGVRF